MKKFLSLILCLSVMALSVSAQRATTMALVAGDTVVTSSSLDTVTKVIPITAGYSALGIQVNGVKVSGTITAKAYVQGSLDGTTWRTIDSSAAFANSAGAQSVWFTYTSTPYVFYRVQVRPPGGATSTESLAVRVLYVARRHD